MKKRYLVLTATVIIISACGGEPPKQEVAKPAQKEATEPKPAATPPEETVQPGESIQPETVAPEEKEESVEVAKVAKPKALKKCLPCHSFDKGGKKKAGPNLFGIHDSEAGKVAGYSYSSNFMKAFKGKSWDDAMLDAWIKDPKALAGKTKMITKISSAKDREEIIGYLKTLK